MRIAHPPLLSGWWLFGQVRRLLLLVGLVSLLSFAVESAGAASPLAATRPATPILPGTMTLNGAVSPNGETTTTWFDWGLRGAYDHSTSPNTLGGSGGLLSTSATIANLVSDQVYQCRLVASNASGIAYGARQWFVNGQKVVAWGEALCGATVLPTGLSNLVAISASGCYDLVLRNDGTVDVWGNYGYLNLRSVALTLTNVISIAQGGFHCLALRSDGVVLGWGDDYYGQIDVPPWLTNVAQLAAGVYHSVSLGTDGSVTAWGNNALGETNIPPGLSNVVAIACGDDHTLALRMDGTVVAWGRNEAGQTNVPPDLTNAVAIAAGGDTSLALRTDGTVVAWGMVNQAYPPADLSNATAIAQGYSAGLALRDDGSVAAWAANSFANTNLPSGMNNVSAIACGENASLALAANVPPQARGVIVSGPANRDQVIMLQGSDANGDLLGFRIVSLPATGSLYQYSAGDRGSLITAAGASVDDPSGRLIFAPAPQGFGSPYTSFDFLANDGQADSTPATVAISVIGQAFSSTQPATDVRPTTATLNGLALLNGLDTVAWFDWGARGLVSGSTSPTNITGVASMLRVSAVVSNLAVGGIYECHLVLSNAAGVARGPTQLFTTGLKLRAWGDNSYGQTNIPAGLTNVVAAAAGLDDTLALRADGRVIAWGTYDGTNVPAGLSNVVAIAAKGHSLALRSDGTIAGWGGNYYGQATPPVGLGNVVAIACGNSHSLALKADGSVVAWGNNYWGQASVPSGLSNVVAISAGDWHSLALKMDGTVAVWGENNYGQLNVPPGLSNVVAIAAGNYHNLALKTDGTITAWGINVPTGLSNVVAVAAGENDGLALKADGLMVAWGDNHYGQTNVPVGLSNIVSLAGYQQSLAVVPNIQPLAASQTNSAQVNQDQVIALKASDSNADPLTFRVTSLPARGLLYQVSELYPFGRGAPILTPDTTVSDPFGHIIFSPGTNEVGRPYASFNFVANDGQLDSLPATVTVNVLLPPAPRFTGLLFLTNGSLQLTFTGGANSTYRVWSSTNLSDWVAIGTAQTVSSGVYRFVDTSAAVWPYRFYRAGAP